jgi:ERCC4-type nuclease
MDIQIDSREKAHAIEKILAEFERQGVNHFVSKLYVADYMSLDNSRLAIDRKQNLSELYCNLCQGHKRFASELTRAQTAGIQLIILIEHGGNIKTIEDVKNWENPRLKVSPYAWDGLRMYKTMITVQGKYGVEWQFCSKMQTGKRIIEILSSGNAVRH